MRYTILISLTVLTISLLSAQEPTNPISRAYLKVHESGRFLVHENGDPFYWLGDTAWELFHRLDKEEAERYLRIRADQGFSIIQAVALAELQGLKDPNAYYHLPLKSYDPIEANDDYFEHVDWIIDKAAAMGLYIALLPTWGDKLFKESWGDGPEIFHEKNAADFGRWIGNRYKDRKNIVWVLMGDRNPRGEQDVDVWRAMARGITEGIGSPDRALITAHPQPTSMEMAGSGGWFHQDDWFDFNMLQTGHCRDNPVYDRISVAYNRIPAKPTIDAEPLYEDHPVCFNERELGRSSAYDVRKGAYLPLFAGAFGNTYGCHDVWQMYSARRKSINGASIPWYNALHLPGAEQMKYVRRLMESRPMLDRIPDQSLLNGTTSVYDRVQATRGKDYAFVYSSKGTSFEVIMGKIAGASVVAHWYNPRNGESMKIDIFENKGIRQFTPPSSGYGQDWILILDDSSGAYSMP